MTAASLNSVLMARTDPDATWWMAQLIMRRINACERSTGTAPHLQYSVSLSFYELGRYPGEGRLTAIYARSTYHNDPDFWHVSSSRVQPDVDEHRTARLIGSRAWV